jgi:hypothetical protein
MVEFNKFFKNGQPSFTFKASGLVVAVVAIVVIAFLTGENTAAYIPKLFGRQ